MVTDSLPALQGFTDLIADMSDKTTTTGQTTGFLADSFGNFFKVIAQNFGILLQFTLLIGGVTVALQAYTAAKALAEANPFGAKLGLAVTLLGGAFIIGASAANRLVEENKLIAKTGVAVNNVLNESGKVSGYVGGKFGYAADRARNLADAMRSIPNVKLEADARNRELTKYLSFLSGRAAKAVSGSVKEEKAFSGGAGGGSKADKAAEEARRKEKERLDKRKEAFKSFNDSVKSLFSQIKESIMSAFSLPDLGNSVNSITKNIAKLLQRTKAFATNIKALSDQGLNATLLQQVIGAGPIEGSKLAQALLSGGSGFINQINQAYGEFGGLAGSIAGVGTQKAFTTPQTVNNYSISVTGGIATSADVGRTVVNAIKDFEKQSGTAWRA
jgi:hypothetical protein